MISYSMLCIYIFLINYQLSVFFFRKIVQILKIYIFLCHKKSLLLIIDKKKFFPQLLKNMKKKKKILSKELNFF